MQINLLELFFKTGTRSNEWFVGHWFSMSKLSCLEAGVLIASEHCSSFPRRKKYADLEISSETQQTRIMSISKVDLKREWNFLI